MALIKDKILLLVKGKILVKGSFFLGKKNL